MEMENVYANQDIGIMAENARLVQPKYNFVINVLKMVSVKNVLIQIVLLILLIINVFVKVIFIKMQTNVKLALLMVVLLALMLIHMRVLLVTQTSHFGVVQLQLMVNAIVYLASQKIMIINNVSHA